MPESIKIRVELDTTQAQRSIEELQRALFQLRPKIESSFKKLSPAAQRQLLGQYTAAGDISATEQRTTTRAATVSRGGIEETELEKYPQKRGTRGRGVTDDFAEALKRYRSGLVSRFRGMEWNFPQNPQGIAQVLQSEKFLSQGVKTAMGMGPLSTGSNWKQAAMGGATAMFSPWLGARMLNQAFPGAFSGLGGAGGGGGGRGIGGALFGAGGGTAFGAWYLLIRTVIDALHALTRIITQAVKQGAIVFQQAAGAGMTGANFAQLKAVLTGAGMSGALGNMTSNPMARNLGASSSALFVRAAMGGNPLEMTQVLNMRREIDRLNEAMTFGSKRIGETSGAMQRINEAFQVAGNTWKGVFADLVASFEPELRLLAEGFNLLGKMFDLWIRFIRAIQEGTSRLFGKILGISLGAQLWDKLTTKPGANSFAMGGPAGSWMMGQSGWEKMGLLINGGPAGRDYARQTAENTKILADHVRKLFPTADTNYMAGNAAPNFNLP